MGANFISGLADLLWPLIFIGVLIYTRKELKAMIASGAHVAFEFMGSKLIVTPTVGRVPKSDPTHTGSESREVELAPGATELPPDYLFLNHTSFLRQDMQEVYKARTNVNYTHYDIRIIVDSYYRGAIESVERVDYYLDRAYPKPIQERTNIAENFLLKEIANGEFVALAKVYLRGRKHPLLLQRYITLWESGPRIEKTPITV